MKKLLTINTLTFEVHGEIYNAYGGYEKVNRRFVADRKSCVLTFLDLDDNGQEQTVTLGQDKMRKLLRWMVA